MKPREIYFLFVYERQKNLKEKEEDGDREREREIGAFYKLTKDGSIYSS